MKSIFRYFRGQMRRGLVYGSLQAVKGTRGYYHATLGEQRHFDKLWTLCYESIFPLHRASGKNARIVINCPRCLDRLSN